MTRVWRFDHVGITVADLDTKAASFVGPEHLPSVAEPIAIRRH